MLKAVSGDVESVGQQDVRGVHTTMYRSSFDLRDLADFFEREGEKSLTREYRQLAKMLPSKVDVEAWIDANGLVRRSRMVMALPTSPGQPAISMDMRIDYLDFDIAPDIRLPDASEVFDATPLMRAKLHLLNGSSALPPPPPAGTEALSSRAFASRANAICVDAYRRLVGLRGTAMPLARNLGRIVGQVRAGSATPRELLAASRAFAYRVDEPAIRDLKRALRLLARLAPPPGRQAEYRLFLRISAQQVEANLAETRAAEIGDFRSAHTLSERTHQLERRSDRAAMRLSLKACTSKKQNN